jgi:hypothetical protein
MRAQECGAEFGNEFLSRILASAIFLTGDAGTALISARSPVPHVFRSCYVSLDGKRGEPHENDTEIGDLHCNCAVCDRTDSMR